MNQGAIDLPALDLIDDRDIDWSRVQRTAFLLHQHLRYDYPGPIADLRQRLVIMPPEHYGDQRLVMHHIEVSKPLYEMTQQLDAFGNQVLQIYVPHVEQSIDFEAWIVVERSIDQFPHDVSAGWLTDPRLLTPSQLTEPNHVLRQIATQLQAHGDTGLALAERINTWTYQHIKYVHEVTDIHTTAAEALDLRQGVCQDYAHVMLALCRLCGLPARYVSGHLLGEGGTHAWVEVIMPTEGETEMAQVWPFDPTHGRRASLSYVTIAVGRDYMDVPPTSGTYRASYRGQLSAHKSVGITALEYGNAVA